MVNQVGCKGTGRCCKKIITRKYWHIFLILETMLKCVNSELKSNSIGKQFHPVYCLFFCTLKLIQHKCCNRTHCCTLQQYCIPNNRLVIELLLNAILMVGAVQLLRWESYNTLHFIELLMISHINFKSNISHLDICVL